MELQITTTRQQAVGATLIAALIAGRRTEIDNVALTAEVAYQAAAAFFGERGVADLESYLGHRSEVKAGLREGAAKIRAMKASLRPMDGYSQGFWKARAELHQAIAEFKELHDTRVLGKAWSAETRRRSDVEARRSAQE